MKKSHGLRGFFARLSCKPVWMPKADQRNQKCFTSATRRIIGFSMTTRIFPLCVILLIGRRNMCAASLLKHRGAALIGKTHHCRRLRNAQHQKNAGASQWKNKCACPCARTFAAHRRGHHARGAWAQSQAMFNFT